MQPNDRTLIAVTTSLGQRAEAQQLARTLVQQKLVASAQISEIESFYIWDDAVQQRREFRLLCKTTKAQYAAVEAAIKEVHSYELPAIHACAFDCVYAPYGDWVESQSSGSCHAIE